MCRFLGHYEVISDNCAGQWTPGHGGTRVAVDPIPRNPCYAGKSGTN